MVNRLLDSVEFRLCLVCHKSPHVRSSVLNLDETKLPQQFRYVLLQDCLLQPLTKVQRNRKITTTCLLLLQTRVTLVLLLRRNCQGVVPQRVRTLFLRGHVLLCVRMLSVASDFLNVTLLTVSMTLHFKFY